MPQGPSAQSPFHTLGHLNRYPASKAWPFLTTLKSSGILFDQQWHFVPTSISDNTLKNKPEQSTDLQEVLWRKCAQYLGSTILGKLPSTNPAL
jgi:hypothetical protein